MTTGDTASDPFSRSAQNEARRDPLTFNGDTTILTRPQQAGKGTSSKSTARCPAGTLR
jgi:hypothetical protein